MKQCKKAISLKKGFLIGIGFVLTMGYSQAQQQLNQNPFPQQSGAIQFNPAAANLDGTIRGVPNTPTTVNSNMGNITPSNIHLPTTPPSGMPQQQNSQQTQQTAQQQVTPAQATINILNTEPDRIRQINRDLFERGRVINESPIVSPRIANEMLVASLTPGSTPPVVRLGRDRATAIVFTDQNGRPWPIVNFDGLSDRDFVVRRLDSPAPTGSILSITPRGTFVSGNLIVILEGVNAPLNIEFVSAQGVVDGSVQIRVQATRVTNSGQFTTIGLPSGINTELLNVLQGVPPTGAKELTVSSQMVQAWLTRDGEMFVRTRYRLMSPAFKQVTQSPDGTFAYKMVPVEVVLFRTQEGRFGEFTVTGF